MLELSIRHLEYRAYKFITSYLKEPQVVCVIDHSSGISIAIDHPVNGVMNRFFKLNWAERSCAHLISFSDGGLLLWVLRL